MQSAQSAGSSARQVGRYLVYGEIASGGMATVHLGRLLGAVGFSKTVAIKRLHEHLASEPEFVAMLIDEAKLVSSIYHPNVVSTLDVVCENDELLIVMDYIEGATLALLLGTLREESSLAAPDPALYSRIVIDALSGLHAAHVAKTHSGEPLNIVHRDVSPQNIMLGVDGIARVLDFGIAKAEHRRHSTRPGQIKGKFAYMSPEQVRGGRVDPRTDIFAAGVVLWECLTRQRLFADTEKDRGIARVLKAPVSKPSTHDPRLSPELDGVVLKALARDPNERFTSAAEFATALGSALAPASHADVGNWVAEMAKRSLVGRSRLLSELETSTIVDSGASIAVSKHTPAERKSSPALAPAPSRADIATVPLGPNAAAAADQGETLSIDPTRNDSRRRSAALAVATFSAGVLITAATYELGWRNAASNARSASVTAPRVEHVARFPAQPPRAAQTSARAADETTAPQSPWPAAERAKSEPAAEHAKAGTPAPAPRAQAPAPAPAPVTQGAAIPTATAAASMAAKSRQPFSLRPKASVSSTGVPSPAQTKAATTGSPGGPPAQSCDPPYRVDELGIRRVRRECL